MHKVCILTDSSVQFTNPDFLGNELVFTFPFAVQFETIKGKCGNLGVVGSHYGIEPPPIKEILKLIKSLHKVYSEILVITLSSALSELFSSVEEAVRIYGDLGRIQFIDSNTTSIGMGVLVQMAAGLAALGATSDHVEHQIRVSIANIYTLLCLPNLSNLAEANFLSHSQAVVGEMLGVLPIFSLEGGSLKPIQKVRTQRHLFESIQEYLDEFIDPYYVALIQNINQIKTTSFRDYVKSNFSRTKYSEFLISDPLVDLLGHNCVGLVVIEDNLVGDPALRSQFY